MFIYDGANTISTQNLNATGVATALSASVLDMTKLQCDTASIQIVGTYTGALTPQVSNDGVNWVTLGGTPLINQATGVGSATVPSGTQGLYQVDVAGFRYFRLVALAAVTGSAVVTMVGSEMTGVVGLDSPLPAGTASIGAVTANMTPLASPGTTAVTVNSAATTNAAVSKASAGVVLNLEANNAAAADKFVRLYNKATAPTVGTDVPIVVIAIKANTSKEIEFGTVGKRFSTGIGHAITNLGTALDATVVAAGDVQLAYDYI